MSERACTQGEGVSQRGCNRGGERHACTQRASERANKSAAERAYALAQVVMEELVVVYGVWGQEVRIAAEEAC